MTFFRYKLTLKDGKLPVHREMVAGGCAGLCQIVVTTPMELLKIQMQDAGRVASTAGAKGGAPKISALSLTMELLKTKGILGLYKGTSATMLRDVSFSICYFPLFANLNALGPKRHPGSTESVFWWSFISGCAAGSISALFVNPADWSRPGCNSSTRTPLPQITMVSLMLSLKFSNKRALPPFSKVAFAE